MDTLIKILDEVTILTKDADLFAYEIPLGKSGAWLAESQTPSTFNGTGYQEYDLYVRFKSKTQGMANIKYLKDTIDSLKGSDGQCMLDDGTVFSLKALFGWSYLEKDSEGYFVWNTTLSLIATSADPIPSA